MKHDVKFLVAGVAMLAIAASSTAVLAADIIDIPEPIVPEIIVQPADISGWYIRGDIGYAGAKFKRAKYATIDNCGSTPCHPTDPTIGSNELFGKLKGSFLLGGGLGYQVTDYFRTDLTLDYMTRAKFKGYSYGSDNCNDQSCASDDRGHMSALSILANAYVDLGNFNGLTPYVGAGIGGTRVSWGDLVDSTKPPHVQTLKGGADWRFTWALMAGLSYDLTENLKLDAGYRFRRISGGEMFKGNQWLGNGYDKSMDVHDVRVGLRYQFGRTAQAVSYSDMTMPVYK